MMAPSCSQSAYLAQQEFAGGLIPNVNADLITEYESRAPKRGVWLMRGAQPATNAGARLFAGSPIPALSPSSKRTDRDQKDANLDL
jgi:hypothetical protein